ncbi:tyrosine kinase receptor Cad96Ca-like isoform X2 [Watersipora subatra]|uniref:tyrosine kinase receptor Cad96Ca-like isoform X2 n=1 Tax=Watersipora subatra TaxID=2589382 RepID=UPI00355C9232
MDGLANNTTASSGSTFLENQYLLPLVSTLGALVVILSTVLIIIYCRRNFRAHRLAATDSMNVKVVNAKPNPSSLRAMESGDLNGLSNRGMSNSITNEEKTLSLGRLNEQPQKSVTHAPVPGLKDISLLQNQSPTRESLGIMMGGGDYLNDPSPAIRVVPPPPAARCPSPPTPSLDDELDSFNPLEESTKSNDSMSTPNLPRIRPRSKGLHNTPLLIDSKETTLRRATGLFRSDTKAYAFYTKTITNYEMNRNQLQSNKLIGKGHFGCVYSGVASKLPNTKQRKTKVGIKTLKSSAPDSEKQEFLFELEIMKLVTSLNHPNIIKLLGCVTKTQPYLIVLELMTNGNLQKFLRDTKTKDVYYNLHGKSDSLNEQHLLKFALDIARGMDGIADLQLLHRDLACRNILVDEHLTCKVADFGFAKDVLNKPEYKSKSVFQRPRPTRWLPPESLFTFKHCIQSDVWSYGVVLWEIVTLGNLPYPHLSTREVMKVIAKGYRMPCPTHCSPDIYRVMAECWEESPSSRPKFKEIVTKIAELLAKATEMINMGRLYEDEYCDTLPPEEQEIHMEYAASETLC